MEKITKHHSQEDVKLYVKHVCEYAETINKVWTAAIELLRTKYDGKQLTKRFTDELNAKFADDVVRRPDGCEFPNVRVSISQGFSYKEIHIYLQRRSYSGGRGWVYVDKEVYVTEVTLYPEFMDGCGHIIADKFIPSIERTIDGNREKIFTMQDAAKNYGKYLKAFAKAKRSFLDACGKINPMFVESEIMTYESDTPWRVSMEQQLGTYKKQY